MIIPKIDVWASMSILYPLEKILKNVQSFLLTCPRESQWSGTGLVEDTWHSVGTFSFSLTFQVGSSRMVVVNLVHSAHTPVHKKLPLWGWWEEVNFNGGLMSFQSTGSSPFSTLCRHQLLPRPGPLVPVKWHWPYNHSITSAFQPQMKTVFALPLRLCTVAHISQQCSDQHTSVFLCSQ